MGMLVNVYRSGHFDEAGNFCPSDCSMDGISSKADRIMVVNVCEGLFDPEKSKYPLAKLVKGNIPGSAKVVPFGKEWEGKWMMFGGNYAASSDSRWNRAVEEITGARVGGPVAIHDRYEG